MNRRPNTDPPRLSRRERRVLELLAGGGEMAGLELVAASRRLQRGTVYLALRRLADKGLVDSRLVDGRQVNGGVPELPLRLFRAVEGGAAPSPREAPIC